VGITRIPKEVYRRFETGFGLDARLGVDVWSVGETLLMVGEATERHGLGSDKELVDAVGEELAAAGRDPKQLCLLILAESDIREELGIPREFEGYPVYLLVLERPQAY
jgi:hypothetical protein